MSAHIRCFTNRIQSTELNLPESSGAELSFRQEIDKVIDSCIVYDPVYRKLTAQVDTALLIDKAHLLARSGLYEEAIRDRMNSYTVPSELEVVERVDAQLRAFVASERKSRARLKLNYIMAGATTNRLEQAIEVLVESDEVDDELLAYTDAVIAKEAVRGGGPAALAEDDRSYVQGANKAALDVLQLVRKRLRAEQMLQQDGREELRLLARLTAEPSLEVRELLIRRSLTRVEQVEAFSALLKDALAHFSRNQSASDLSSQVGTLERLRDVSVSLDRLGARLRTGLRDDSQYSTSPEDYLDSS